jgi:murein DD-endopeptidase MepM/ murein hydrolase activator NlpD
MRADAASAAYALRPPGTEHAGSVERARVDELAREFEAMMTRQVLRQMRESQLSDDENEGLGAGTLTDTTDGELARLLANGSALGLANAVRRAIERQTMPAAEDSGPARAGGYQMSGATVTLRPVSRQPEAADDGPAVPLPLHSRITSHFGWRQDPFGAGPRFHSGIDIAAAYGREVDAVSEGRVAFAGTAPGYGNTVVIEHPGGATTRYAHLAAVDVYKGERVQAGEAIGTVGQTGRSTGPHLHFELLQDGRPVNPELAALRYDTALKNVAAVAD